MSSLTAAARSTMTWAAASGCTASLLSARIMAPGRRARTRQLRSRGTCKVGGNNRLYCGESLAGQLTDGNGGGSEEQSAAAEAMLDSCYMTRGAAAARSRRARVDGEGGRRTGKRGQGVCAGHAAATTPFGQPRRPNSMLQSSHQSRRHFGRLPRRHLQRQSGAHILRAVSAVSSSGADAQAAALQAAPHTYL